jgi:LPXTG-motif cell wall-anchored protein
MIGFVGQRAIAVVDAYTAGRAVAAAHDTRTVLQNAGISSKLAAAIAPTPVVKGGGVTQAVPKKSASSSSMTPILVVGGLVAAGLVAVIVMKKRKKD